MGIMYYDFKILGPNRGQEPASIFGVGLVQVWFVPRRLA
jgi:hypothetical protein